MSGKFTKVPGADGGDDLAHVPLAELENRLQASPEGLSAAESAQRLAQYGPNEIVEKTVSPLRKFLGYFWGPIPWMIEIAVVLSAIDRHWPDFFIILVLLLANGVVGYTEERQAGNAQVPVVISADRNVKYDAVVKVMDTLQRGGVQRVGLSVQQGR